MSLLGILVLAIGLSMDAMAVAVARGASGRGPRFRSALELAVFFGGAQALMPLLGWLIGSRVGPWVEAWDHWIAFVILSFIGGKMLWEARGEPDTSEPKRDLRVLLLLSVATSIDALAAGVTLPLLDAPVALSVVTIGITTALLSGAGYYLGHQFGARLGKTFDIIGGLVLIGLGTKTLLEHTVLK